MLSLPSVPSSSGRSYGSSAGQLGERSGRRTQLAPLGVSRAGRARERASGQAGPEAELLGSSPGAQLASIGRAGEQLGERHGAAQAAQRWGQLGRELL